MKLFHVLSLIILCAAISLTSCSDSEKDQRAEEARQTLPEAPPITNTATNQGNSPLANPQATTNNEPHYKCPNNCAGGVGESAGPCPVCGSELAHNQAYHNNTTPTTTTPPPTTTTPPPTTTPEPAQNAAGVWHYTCAAGCAGGAGAAGTCGTCGGALTHNAAYHQ